MKDFLDSKWYIWISLIALALTFIGFGWGIWSYLFPRNTVRPIWKVQSFTAVHPRAHIIPGTRIFYLDEEVKSLTASRFALWNEGSVAIEGSSFDRDDPLRISVPDGVRILEVNPHPTLNPSLVRPDIRINHQRSSAFLSFSFLNRDQGLIVDIVHSGVGSKNIRLEGRIKNAPMLKRRPALTSAILIPFLFLLWPAAVLGLSVDAENPSPSMKVPLLAVGSVVFISGILFCVVQWYHRIPNQIGMEFDKDMPGLEAPIQGWRRWFESR
jgi:hypothetical protein